MNDLNDLNDFLLLIIILLSFVVCIQVLAFYISRWWFNRKPKSDKSELNKRDVSEHIKDLMPIEKPISMMSDGIIHEKLYGVKNAWEGVRVEDCSPEECKRKLLVQNGDLAGLLELENSECEKAMNNLKEKIEESNSERGLPVCECEKCGKLNSFENMVIKYQYSTIDSVYNHICMDCIKEIEKKNEN